MTHPSPPPVSRAHVIAELYNLLGLFASLQTSRVELAGFVRCYNRKADQYLWLRVRGRAVFRYVEPSAYRQAYDAATPDELAQLRREALAYNSEE